MRVDDDPLHPAERENAAGRGGQGNRKGCRRRRHPHRLCDRGARPESGRVWRWRAGSVCAGGRRSQGDRGAVRARADVAKGIHRTHRCHCLRHCRPEGGRATRAGRRAVVLKAAAGSGCRKLGANRPPHSHASAGDHLSARLGGSKLSAGHRPLPQRHRLPVGAADTGALHPRPAGRTRDDRRLRRAHRHQFQLQHASALRPRADCRRACVRLPHRRRRRWPGAGRRR